MHLICRKLSVSLTHSQADISLSLNDKRKSKVACNAEFKPKVYFSAKLGDHFNLHYLAISKGTIFKSDSLKVEVKKMPDAVSSLLGESSEKHHRISPLKVEIAFKCWLKPNWMVCFKGCWWECQWKSCELPLPWDSSRLHRLSKSQVDCFRQLWKCNFGRLLHLSNWRLSKTQGFSWVFREKGETFIEYFSTLYEKEII